jgi:hypothetical protein
LLRMRNMRTKIETIDGTSVDYTASHLLAFHYPEDPLFGNE